MIKNPTQTRHKPAGRTLSSESGEGRLKLMIVLVILAAVAIFLYNYAPVAYNAYLFKDYMQHEVDVAAASGYDETWLKTQVTKSAAEYQVPANAEVLPRKFESRLELTVKFKRQVDFPGYTYDYEFDNTVKSTQFLTSTGK